MPYIDSEYYIVTYKGIMPSNPDDLDTLILRASDVIDIVTSYKLQGVDIDVVGYNTFIKDQVKKATAAQVEYFVVNGGYANALTDASNSADSASIGSFSYSGGGGRSSSLSSETRMTSPTVLQYLYPTGLLYSGINTNDPNGWQYDY